MNPTVFRELINEILIQSRLLSSDRSAIKGLTPKQVHILAEISDHLYTHGELAKRLRVDSSTLTRTIDPLVKKNLITREINPRNRREILIQLTTQGLEILDKINSLLDEYCGQILKKVPSDQQEMVELSIRILVQIMRQKNTLRDDEEDTGIQGDSYFR
jgi:DNA-binding MarR family transcriptional regulator